MRRMNPGYHPHPSPDAGRRVDEAMKTGLSSMLGGLNLPPGLI